MQDISMAEWPVDSAVLRDDQSEGGLKERCRKHRVQGRYIISAVAFYAQRSSSTEMCIGGPARIEVADYRTWGGGGGARGERGGGISWGKGHQENAHHINNKSRRYSSINKLYYISPYSSSDTMSLRSHTATL